MPTLHTLLDLLEICLNPSSKILCNGFTVYTYTSTISHPVLFYNTCVIIFIIDCRRFTRKKIRAVFRIEKSKQNNSVYQASGVHKLVSK